MASRAWTRFADVWRVQRPRACLLPVAVRPWQKALCATAGLAAFSTAAATAGYTSLLTLQTAHDVYHRHGDGLRSRLERVRPAQHRQQQPGPRAETPFARSETASRRATVSKAVETSLDVFMVVISPPIIVATTYGIFWDARNTFRMVRGTTACCDIVCHTAFYCARTPLLALLLGAYSVGGCLALRDLCDAATSRENLVAAATESEKK